MTLERARFPALLRAVRRTQSQPHPRSSSPASIARAYHRGTDAPARPQLEQRVRRPLARRPRDDQYAGPRASEAVDPGSVHVVIKPRPRTLSESVEVLQKLQQFGEVVMYRNMKYQADAPAPNRALAIFRSPDAAAKAIAASPLRFMLGETRHEAGLLRDDAEMRAILGDEIEDAESYPLDAEADAAAWPPTGEDSAWAETSTKNVGPEARGSEQVEFAGEVVPPWVLYQENEAAIAAGRSPGASAASPPSTSLISSAPDSSSGSAESAASQPTDSATLLDALLHNPSSLNLRAPPRPSVAPPIADAPWYRHSPGRTQSGSGNLPTFFDPPPREAVIHINASGMAARFYNLRQPYFSTFAANSRCYPSDTILGELPDGMQGIGNTDYTQTEVGPSIRGRREAARAKADKLKGRTLSQIREDGREWRRRNGITVDEMERTAGSEVAGRVSEGHN